MLNQWRISMKPAYGFIRHESDHSVPKEWFKRWLTDYDIWIISEGSAYLMEDQATEHLLQRGSVVCLRPQSTYSVRQEKGAERLSLSFFHFDIFDLADSPVDSLALSEIPTVMECHDPEFLEAICQRIHRLPLSWQDDGTSADPAVHRHAGVLLKTLLTDACQQHFSHTQSDASSLNALRYRQMLGVMAEIRQNPIRFSSVADIARYCTISPDYVTKLFLRVFNISPRDALIDARMEKAKLFLSGSTLTVSEIGEELGYKNIYFFSRQFRERVGMPPSAYRHSLER